MIRSQRKKTKYSEPQNNLVDKSPVVRTGNIGSYTNLYTDRIGQKRNRLNMGASSTVSSASVKNNFNSANTESCFKNTENDTAQVQSPFQDEMKVLFTHNAEICCGGEQSQEWIKGIINLVAKSDDPSSVRLSMKTGVESHDELLTVHMQFEIVSKTTINVKWSGENFPQNEARMDNATIRFKTSKICEKFHKVVLNVQEQLKAKLDESGKHLQYMN